MLFNTPAFVLLLVVTFAIFYVPALRKQQLTILIISSLVFYASDKPEFVALLLVSAFINVIVSYFVVYGKTQYRKILSILGLVLNIGILIFFKYSPLISETLFSPESSIGAFLLYMPLPIGISFFTFEGISLVVDVWKEKYTKGENIVSPNLLEHAKKSLFFISFFPHLIAGPILKAHDFYPQMNTKYFKDIHWQDAFKALVIGYFLKMVVADNLKDFTIEMRYPIYEWRSSATLLTYVWGYSCQIFADFAGYSSIAIGLGKLFGYNLNQNFNFPYIATSFKEFWKRWHISLSTFLMEYLYFPLGGNRKGKWRTYFNLIITMTLGGLWHGVAWSYALWGLLHGLALAIERFCICNQTNEKAAWPIKILRWLMVFSTVSLFWLFFKLPDLNHVIGFLVNLVSNVYMMNYIPFISYILIYSSPIVIYHLVYLLKRKDKFNHYFKKTEFIWYAFLLFFILLNSGPTGSFIYFQF